MAYQHKEFYIQSSRDNTKLYCQAWIKPDANRVLVFNHGFGEHSGRYGNLINYFKDSDVSFYGFDMRGHGKSDGKRGHADTFELFVDDLADFIQEVRRREKKDKILLLGHSMGGVVVIRYALEGINQDYLHAVVACSPALKIPANTFQKFQIAVAGFLRKLSPGTTLDANLDVNLISHDPEVVKAYVEDPLVHGKISFSMGYELFQQGEIANKKAAILRTPILILHGLGDKIADPAGSLEFYNHLVYKNKRIKTYPGFYHETMNEVSPDKETVLKDIKEFLDSLVPEKTGQKKN
ncbi:putative lysophospholipase [Leptospira broomii serovar Hurstbridge str. 5399]|uniref:Monoacylglycerol lipase n=1 Tax=Leptospira broomii serovar Hurstbridge str. 5399 TaxID=1049789 RepID=T0GE74_9LEPT|nr:alpha/beta hydrolase [Leptospira broomii]EQA45104.1 putative lysophospholipase [Leptospira broomii serovar Hurstbridge str. 5399]